MEDLCVQKMGAKIYELLVQELHTNITNKVVTLQQQVIFLLSYRIIGRSVFANAIRLSEHREGVSCAFRSNFSNSFACMCVCSVCVQAISDSRSYLQLVDGVWSDHVEQLNTVRNIFLYLDR